MSKAKTDIDHMVIKFFFPVLLFVSISACSTQNRDNFFVNKFQCTGAYANECSGDKFYQNCEFLVSTKLCKINFHLNLTPLKNSEDITLTMDRANPRIKKTADNYPSKNKNDHLYFVRLTPLYILNGEEFQGIWVKGGDYTSGFYYLIKVTSNKRYELIKIVKSCDNWG